MTARNLTKRLEAIAERIGGSRVVVLRCPHRNMSDAELDAWEAEATAGIPPTALVVVLRSFGADGAADAPA